LKLLNEIIDSLSSQESSLTGALLKTKVLLHNIGHKELVEWVNHELNGYPHDGELPEYRILPAQVLANLANMAYQVNSHPIPLGHLDAEVRERFETARMYQSLAVLEKLTVDEDGFLESPIPMQYNGIFGRSLANGYMIQRVWSSIGKADVVQIFIQVRSRLLDFVLELKEQIGDNVSDQEIKKRTDSIDASSLFNNAIFGNNTTIVVGNHNSQDITNIISKGDFSALAEHLKKHGITESSISELQTAIRTDENSLEVRQEQYGPAVKTWLQSMLSKAVDSSWNIELGVASSLLATALQNYYGWP
jgi:hypothetical protein